MNTPKLAQKEANRLADNLISEFHEQVVGNQDLRHAAYDFLKTAAGAYQLTRTLVMFAWMELNTARANGIVPDLGLMSSLMMSAKFVAYQHYILNRKMYGLTKTKSTVARKRGT